MYRIFFIGYGAGTLGALANSIFVWAMGQWGVNSSLGILIHPNLTTNFLYPRLVWGGIWGIALYKIALKSTSFWSTSFLISLLPTAFQLLYVFPNISHKGMWGLQLGQLTPLLVIVANWVWAMVFIRVSKH